MNDQSLISRANLLAQMASNRTVTTDVLADQERQFVESRLVGPPPVERLDKSEAPAFVFTNQKRGIGLGSKRNTTAPDSDRGTVVVVTGRRILCLVGTEPDDEVVEIPIESIAAATAHTGLLANRLEIRTPRKAYHIWTDRNTDDVLAAAAEFIADRMFDDPEELARRDGANRITYRGQSIDQTPDNTPSQATPADDPGGDPSSVDGD
ncbi:MAG: PH domain-containing protein [Halovenus sp.]|uniref:PH domain-containing protein n=1 Tax=Halovenus amylolytica TaxID=2500550 RepID=UPI000FE37689